MEPPRTYYTQERAKRLNWSDADLKQHCLSCSLNYHYYEIKYSKKDTREFGVDELLRQVQPVIEHRNLYKVRARKTGTATSIVVYTCPNECSYEQSHPFKHDETTGDGLGMLCGNCNTNLDDMYYSFILVYAKLDNEQENGLGYNIERKNFKYPLDYLNSDIEEQISQFHYNVICYKNRTVHYGDKTS